MKTILFECFKVVEHILLQNVKVLKKCDSKCHKKILFGPCLQIEVYEAHRITLNWRDFCFILRNTFWVLKHRLTDINTNVWTMYTFVLKCWKMCYEDVKRVSIWVLFPCSQLLFWIYLWGINNVSDNLVMIPPIVLSSRCQPRKHVHCWLPVRHIRCHVRGGKLHMSS